MSYRDRSVGIFICKSAVNFKVGEYNIALVFKGLIVNLFTQHHSQNLLRSLLIILEVIKILGAVTIREVSSAKSLGLQLTVVFI